jgi:hypothetical protein
METVPMSLILDLPPAIEARLKAEAAHRGISTEDYARRLLEGALGWPAYTPEGDRPFYETATREEWLKRFHDMIDELALLDVPDLPDEALRRENMYEDRW